MLFILLLISENRVVAAVPTTAADAVVAMMINSHHHLQAHGDLRICTLLQAFRYSAEKANDAQDGGSTPQLQTRVPAGAQNGAVGSQQQQADAVNGFNGQHQQPCASGGPLQPFNGPQSAAPWKAPWQQDVSKPVQHRCKPFCHLLKLTKASRTLRLAFSVGAIKPYSV